MPRRTLLRVVNSLPALLAQRGMTSGELARRTLLPAPLLGRLRAAGANPRLAVAERVAAALGVPVESVWTLGPRRRR
jgi:transcriptional regulator with XRE-family HTH domain